MPDLSVIIVSYRTPDLLRRCLETLARYPGRRTREIIVVDNDSGDDCPEVARGFAGVTLVETGENLGFAGGVNRGLEAASGRYIAVLNPDLEVREDTLDRLADFLDAHPTTGIAAPRLLNPDGSLQHSCRRHYTLTTVVLRRTPLGRMFPDAGPLRRHLMLDYDHAHARAVDWVAGAAMMVRREAVADVGPMDERYFLYFEDVDWCSRMQARGWDVSYVPDAVATHHWQRASNRLGPAARRHLGSGLRFYERWGGLAHVARQNADRWRSGLLLAGDVAAVALAFLGAWVFRGSLASILHKPHWPLGDYAGFYGASIAVYIAGFAILGLYREIKRGDWVDVGFRIARGSTLAALVLMASTVLLDIRGYSRVIIFGTWPLAAAGAFLWRRLLHAFLTRAQRDRWNLRRVALVGEDAELDRLEETMRRQPALGWDPVRIRRPVGTGGDPATLVRQLTAERVVEVVLTPGALGVSAEALPAAALPLRRAGFAVRLMSGFVAGLPARARIEPVGEVSWIALDRPGLGPAGASKRALDLAAAGGLWALGALPVLLVLGARSLLRRPLREPEAVLRGRWGETLRVRRLAGAGRLAWWPALGHVLAGRLSLVGPRPLRPGEPVPGGEAWVRIREGHRPGLVGPWTLQPAHSSEEEMQQERRYLEDWSPELDLKLLTRVALRREGGGSGRGSAPATEPGPAHPEPAPGRAPGSTFSTGIRT